MPGSMNCTATKPIQVLTATRKPIVEKNNQCRHPVATRTRPRANTASSAVETAIM